MCKFLGTIPSDQLQYAKVPFWNNIQIPLSKHTWELKIIAIWNTKGRVCLNAHNKDWLKELAKEIPEAKWEVINIHDHPYQTSLGSGQHSGLNKCNKLPNDHPQAPECPGLTSALISTDQPHNCNIDKAPQNSSSQNLTRKVKDWRDWTYTDGGLQKNKVGQDTGSGVYHPHLNVSHYVNPKGMGKINTISRAELAAIAAAVIHGFTQMPQTALHYCTKSKSSCHTQISIATTSKEMSFNPLLTQSANNHHPSTFSKLNPMPVLSVINMPTYLLKSQPPPTPTLQTPPLEQQALREIPSTTSTGLQKKT
jgi:hypothetical protein